VALGLAALVVVVAGSAAVGWLWATLLRPSPVGEVELVVPAGLSGRQAMELLHEHSLLPSPLAGRLYLRVAAAGRSPRWGHYRIAADARPVAVIEQLLAGRVELVTVTVIEGSDIDEVARQMTASGIGDPGSWLAATRRVEWISDLAPEATSLEGFLYPDTYQFAVGTDVETAARHMVETFREVWQRERAGVAEPRGSPYETIILASLVEAETGVDAERARVAGVYLNRLRRGMLLQCDPTVVFALKRRGEWDGQLLRVDLAVDDPFNTYRYPGLPPGPINSPGGAAIRAALDPEAHDLLYFVVSPDGGHAFSRTLAEHNRAVARWRSSRR
jgi:UPF0755 protein